MQNKPGLSGLFFLPSSIAGKNVVAAASEPKVPKRVKKARSAEKEPEAKIKSGSEQAIVVADDENKLFDTARHAAAASFLPFRLNSAIM